MGSGELAEQERESEKNNECERESVSPCQAVTINVVPCGFGLHGSVTQTKMMQNHTVTWGL